MPARRVKHLNPRQGITTKELLVFAPKLKAVLCETPKSPPGDYNVLHPPASMLKYACTWCETPKSPPGDYNSYGSFVSILSRLWIGVKHLNPRQGITTRPSVRLRSRPDRAQCETPKSPPGDYNSWFLLIVLVGRHPIGCETPKSPPGDYNLRRRVRLVENEFCHRVKHLNPRQGITTGTRSTADRLSCFLRV